MFPRFYMNFVCWKVVTGCDQLTGINWYFCRAMTAPQTQFWHRDSNDCYFEGFVFVKFMFNMDWGTWKFMSGCASVALTDASDTWLGTPIGMRDIFCWYIHKSLLWVLDMLCYDYWGSCKYMAGESVALSDALDVRHRTKDPHWHEMYFLPGI